MWPLQEDWTAVIYDIQEISHSPVTIVSAYQKKKKPDNRYDG